MCAYMYIVYSGIYIYIHIYNVFFPAFFFKRHCHRLHVVCFFLHRAAGSLIGQGVSNFITDWDKVSATVSTVLYMYPV